MKVFKAWTQSSLRTAIAFSISCFSNKWPFLVITGSSGTTPETAWQARTVWSRNWVCSKELHTLHHAACRQLLIGRASTCTALYKQGKQATCSNWCC